MQGQALVDYVKRVMDLEKDVYTNQQIQDNFENSAIQWKPILPPKPKLESTDRPTPPIYDKSPWYADFLTHNTPLPSQERIEKGFDKKRGVIFALFTVLGVVVCIDGIARIEADFGFGYIELWMGLLIASMSIYFLFLENKFSKQAESVKEKYRHDVAIYKNELEKYNATIEQVKAENEEKQSQYRLALDDYYRKANQYMQTQKNSYTLIIESGQKLRQSLSSLYNMDIIYPKYRNLVAVSTIYEYLSSGRCDRLDGPDGAYNLYEMELRQNIVIGQLSSIIENLNQIKNNQFVLYNELVSANQKAASLLADIGNNVKISAYQNEAAAKNAEALKYISLIKH